MSDHHEVYERLFDVSAKWRDLGGALGLEYNTLTTIGSNYRGIVQDCLREMLAKRLQSGGPLSWGELCNCLRKRTVGHNDLAAEIEQEISRHCDK